MIQKSEAEKSLDEYLKFDAAISSSIENLLLFNGKSLILPKSKIIETVVKQLSQQYESAIDSKKIEQRVIRFLSRPGNKFASKRGRKGGIFLATI